MFNFPFGKYVISNWKHSNLERLTQRVWIWLNLLYPCNYMPLLITNRSKILTITSTVVSRKSSLAVANPVWCVTCPLRRIGAVIWTCYTCEIYNKFTHHLAAKKIQNWKFDGCNKFSFLKSIKLVTNYQMMNSTIIKAYSYNLQMFCLYTVDC